jgi:ABC-type nitrate/sulfonate/bicarbonate transport system substrate-binding protein
MIYTSGSGETLQPVISGSVDLGLAVGTLGAMAAYAKGAPVRIIGRRRRAPRITGTPKTLPSRH